MCLRRSRLSVAGCGWVLCRFDQTEEWEKPSRKGEPDSACSGLTPKVQCQSTALLSFACVHAWAQLGKPQARLRAWARTRCQRGERVGCIGCIPIAQSHITARHSSRVEFSLASLAEITPEFGTRKRSQRPYWSSKSTPHQQHQQVAAGSSTNPISMVARSHHSYFGLATRQSTSLKTMLTATNATL